MVTNNMEQRQTVFFGLSTDEKPAAENGSCFLELDDGKIFFYDGGSGQWIEWEG